MTAPARTTDRLDLADDLRSLVHRGAEGNDVRSRLQRTLGQLPAGARATVHEFVLLWIGIDAGHATAVAEWFQGVDVYADLNHYQREACEACDKELSRILDWALANWSVWSVSLRGTRPPSEWWPGLTQAEAEAKAARAREMGGEVNVTFVACAPGQTPAVAT